MEYQDFEYDFVIRTLRNIEVIEKQIVINKENNNDTTFYEFTNLINQCLGLILLPKQFSENNSKIALNQELSYYGLDEGVVTLIKNNKPKTLNHVLHYLRNGIAHGHIQQVIDGSDDITDIKIWDVNPSIKNPTENDAHTIIEFRVEELKTFAIKVAKEYCRLKEEELNQQSTQ